jgi:hypothetical protein
MPTTIPQDRLTLDRGTKVVSQEGNQGKYFIDTSVVPCYTCRAFQLWRFSSPDENLRTGKACRVNNLQPSLPQ